MPQYAILRFSKCKLAPAGALEAHHERKKKRYASNPDVDTSRSGENFHIVQPAKSYRQEIKQRIQAAGCRTRKDSTIFVDTIITASPALFKGKSKQAVRAYFTEAIAFMTQKVGEGNIFAAVVHMDERTPHMHLCFTPITGDGRLSAKEILGSRAQLSHWQDQFYAHMVEAFPRILNAVRAPVIPAASIFPHAFSSKPLTCPKKRTKSSSCFKISIRLLPANRPKQRQSECGHGLINGSF